MFLVRARNPKHLETLFPNAEVVLHAGSDYVARVTVPRSDLMALLADRLNAISATNFKNSVEDDHLHDLYLDFWGRHLKYQDDVAVIRAAPRIWQHMLEEGAMCIRPSTSTLAKPRWRHNVVTL